MHNGAIYRDAKDSYMRLVGHDRDGQPVWESLTFSRERSTWGAMVPPLTRIAAMPVEDDEHS